MNKLFSIILTICLTLGLSGCSLIPRLTFSKPGVTPVSTNKSNKDVRCQGELKINKDTGEISCTKGYSERENNFKQDERKYTIAERVANFIRGLAGWGFWGLVLVLILCPGLAGWLIGRVFNVFRSGLEGTVRAIGNFKSKIPTITLNGVEVPNPDYVKAVDALLDELETEHVKDPNILKTISDIRLKLKIQDND